MKTTRLLAIGLTTALAAGCAARGAGIESPTEPEAAASATPAAAAGTVWAGVYTDAQADRIWDTYVAQCSVCHSEAMTGGPGAPGIVGPAFMFNWDGQTVGALFEYVKSMMPPGSAGTLSDQEYVDLVAVILQGNEFPSSTERELAADMAALGGIRIVQERP